MSKSASIISSHITIIEEMDDFMETLSDLNLLNEEWKAVATEIWEKTKKEDKWKTRKKKLDILMEAHWSLFDDNTKNYLLSIKDTLNQTAKDFLKSKNK